MEKYWRVGEVRDNDITRRMSFACWIPNGTNKSSEYVIPIFPTATMVAQTRLSVVLYVRCFVQCKSHMSLLPLLLAICSNRPTMRELNIFAFCTNNFQLRAVTVIQKYSQQTKHRRTISYHSFTL